MYSEVSPALIDPVYFVVGHDEEGNAVTDADCMIVGGSGDMAAFDGYLSVIKVLEPRALFTLKGTHDASVDHR